MTWVWVLIVVVVIVIIIVIAKKKSTSNVAALTQQETGYQAASTSTFTNVDPQTGIGQKSNPNYNKFPIVLKTAAMIYYSDGKGNYWIRLGNTSIPVQADGSPIPGSLTQWGG